MKRTESAAHIAAIKQRVEHVAAIPLDLLRYGDARTTLMELALADAQVDAYPVQGGDEWRVWLAPAFPDWYGRMTLAEWQDAYTLASAYDSTTDCQPVEVGIQIIGSNLLIALRDAQAQRVYQRPDVADCYERAISFLRWRLLIIQGYHRGQYLDDLGHGFTSFGYDWSQANKREREAYERAGWAAIGNAKGEVVA